MYLGVCHRYRFVQMYLRYNLVGSYINMVMHCATVTVLNLLMYFKIHVQVHAVVLVCYSQGA